MSWKAKNALSVGFNAGLNAEEKLEVEKEKDEKQVEFQEIQTDNQFKDALIAFQLDLRRISMQFPMKIVLLIDEAQVKIQIDLN